ncbi:MAG: hypothetical protein KME16_17640 [Scytolyngbya sp. HA4215-MV1]|jgi:hypothetical protein|nr:hypothetical protein [Scytolyngbya sp. HA4215-MV1]
MSEAVTSSHEMDLPRSPIVPFQPAEFPPLDRTTLLVESANAEADWQTVNFPNTLSIDAIPGQESEFDSDSFQRQPSNEEAPPMETPTLLAVITELHQRNAALQQRIAELEEAIALQQHELDQKVALIQHKEALLVQHSQSVDDSQVVEALQAQLSGLLQELVASQQAVQQQQSLIDTLTAQLDSSQERVAQLERECALTQQRHHEQVQLLMQAESTCRDLRSRLHRQQRQTLQYKAALEQCLEMPLTDEWVSNLADSVESASQPLNDSAVQRLTSKAQPVQPWSAQPGLAVPTFNKLRARWATAASLNPVASEESPVTQSAFSGSDPWDDDRETSDQSFAPASTPPMLTIVPSPSTLAEEADLVAVEDSPETVDSQEASSQAAIVESLSQQNLEHLPIFTPALERQIDKVVQSLMSESGSQEDSLWEDLARLIGFPTETTAEVTPQTASAPDPSEPATQDMDRLVQADFTSAELAAAALSPATLTPVFPESTALKQDGSAPIAPTEVNLEVNAWDETSVNSTNWVADTDTSLSSDEDWGDSEDNDRDESDTSRPAASEKLKYRSTEVLNLFRQVLHPIESSITVPPPDRPTASPFITLSPNKSSHANASDFEQPMATSNTATLAAPGPSPLVYPFRSSKKLKSLAAVELPTFPRPGR